MFNFFAPSKIICGKNSIAGINLINFGNTFGLITHKVFLHSEILYSLLQSFEKNGLKVILYEKAGGEPTISTVENAATFFKNHKVDGILGFGGGSVLDTAKAVCGLVNSDFPLVDYLEGVGKDRKIEHAVLPFFAIPTTAGTGSELTKNSAIASDEGAVFPFKKSFRDERLSAKVVILDETTQVFTPKNITAISGMDAITQLIETYTTKNANIMTDSLCLEALKLCPSLISAYDNNDLESRKNMLIASAISGIGIANGGLGLAHGIGAGMGVCLGIVHGKSVATILPAVMKFNRKVNQKKYAAISNALFSETKNEDYAVEKLIDWVEFLCDKFEIPTNLKGLNVDENMMRLIAKSSMGNSTNGNARGVCEDDIVDILQKLV